MALSFSCKTTTQTTKSETELKEFVQADIVEQKNEVSQEAEKILQIDSTSVEVQANTTTTVVEYSAPDSTGKQHIVRVAITESATNTKTRTNSSKETEVEKAVEIDEKKTDKSISELELNTKTDEKITEKKRSTVAGILALLGILAVFVVVLFILKKIGIIKW